MKEKKEFKLPLPNTKHLGSIEGGKFTPACLFGPPGFNADCFDDMTQRGFKLDLVTGKYYRTDERT